MSAPVQTEPATTPPVVRRRGHVSTVLGAALVLLGLAVTGYLVWEYVGTTYVSHRHQEQTVRQLRQEWTRPSSGVDAGSGQVRTGSGIAGAIVRIPRFGADFEVPVIEGTDDDALAAGVGHYADTAGPGEVGNYALAGHRITHGEPFRSFPDLEVGDEVVVETATTTYTYRLDTGGESLDVPLTDTWVVAASPVDPDGAIGPLAGQTRLITLTTCAELFHTDDRLVVFGHLVSARPS